MVDKYIWGEVSRISPEAPVQVVNVVKENHIPGGAANVAVNVASLGAKVKLMGIAGKDDLKKKLIYELEEKNISHDGISEDVTRPTTLKVRVFGSN